MTSSVPACLLPALRNLTSSPLHAKSVPDGPRTGYVSGQADPERFIESFNGKFREDWLKQHWCAGFDHAREIAYRRARATSAGLREFQERL